MRDGSRLAVLTAKAARTTSGNGGRQEGDDRARCGGTAWKGERRACVLSGLWCAPRVRRSVALIERVGIIPSVLYSLNLHTSVATLAI
jgi:hypothetical protein